MQNPDFTKTKLRTSLLRVLFYTEPWSFLLAVGKVVIWPRLMMFKDVKTSLYNLIHVNKQKNSHWEEVKDSGEAYKVRTEEGDDQAFWVGLSEQKNKWDRERWRKERWWPVTLKTNDRVSGRKNSSRWWKWLRSLTC